MDLSELYQELIIDHGTEPRNYHAIENASHTADGYNPLCGDKIKLYLLLDGDIIREASFVGAGCAISTASASIMTEILIGKTQAQTMEILNSFKCLVTGQELTAQHLDDLGKLLALTGVRAFPSRIKCATLPWHTLDAALQHKHELATTE